MSEHWLSSEEVRLITGRIRASAQRRVLTERRIQFILDADGRPVVLRQHVTGQAAAKKKAEPKWPQSAAG